MRDAEIHSMQQITAANYNQYTFPQVGPLSVAIVGLRLRNSCT